MTEVGFEPKWIKALGPYENSKVNARCAHCRRILDELIPRIDEIHAEEPFSYIAGEKANGGGKTVKVGGKSMAIRPHVQKSTMTTEAGVARTIQWKCKCGRAYRRNIYDLRGDFLRCVRAGSDLWLS
jgi:hypothetical protein